MCHLPLAALNQLVIWDELCHGRKPQWLTDGDQGAKDIEALLADAMTAQP
jgi:hypothetical protein